MVQGARIYQWSNSGIESEFRLVYYDIPMNVASDWRYDATWCGLITSSQSANLPRNKPSTPPCIHTPLLFSQVRHPGILTPTPPPHHLDAPRLYPPPVFTPARLLHSQVRHLVQRPAERLRLVRHGLGQGRLLPRRRVRHPQLVSYY